MHNSVLWGDLGRYSIRCDGESDLHVRVIGAASAFGCDPSDAQ
jgi:hypothetical protein